MGDFLQLLIAGATSGSVYGLVALTFTIIYNATKLINFAQGEFVMLGAMLAVFLTIRLQFPVPIVMGAVILCVAVFGIGFERVVLRPLRKRRVGLVGQIIGTLAAAMIISNTVALFGGKSQLGLPEQFGETIIRYKELSIAPQSLGVILVTFVVVLVMWIFFKKTVMGLSVLATGYNGEAARLMGISVSRVVVITFIVSAGFSGLAGCIIAPLIGASAYMGLRIAIKGFIAAIVGGLTTPAAALVGGLFIGVTETLTAGYLSSAFNEVLTLGLMLVVLMVRPTGIFAERE